ncbi:hypothetical protein GCM10017559_06300 [Streptosporangium longisporum]|uniref:SfnB family sulfur acquisition oxidoreductase n=1 Tax=Streptosporangium longisporum TaxID=46187 RepID=A0ABN3XR17_9ACTN
MSIIGTTSQVPDRPGGHVIADDEEAIATARTLAAEFATGAAERDAERLLPVAELDRLSASGLLAITVPRAFGGADVRAETLAEVVRLLAAADPNIAQIPQSHFVYVNVLRRQGTPEQQKFFFGEVLAGARLGNAQSEAGTRHVQDYRTRLVPDGEDGFLLRGVKHYSTGALFAHWIPVLARREDETLHVAYVPRDADGLTVIDDWAGMGQRTTASGTVRLDDVRVPADRVVPHHLTFTGPQLHGAVAQLLHAAIDVGIAGGALAEALDFVRTRARPWFESGLDSAAEDPLTVQRAGELTIKVRGRGGAAGRGGPPGGRGGGGPDRGVRGRGLHRGGDREGLRRSGRGRAGQRDLRAGRHPRRPGRAQPPPSLAQRQDAHAARPGPLEGPAHRPLRAQRAAPTPPRPALAHPAAPTTTTTTTTGRGTADDVGRHRPTTRRKDRPVTDRRPTTEVP